MTETRFEIELHLVNGKVITEEFTEDEAKELVASRAFIWRKSMSEDDKQAAAIFTILSQRMDKGTGFLSVTDPQHRTWLLPVVSILTFNIRDRRDSGDRLRQLGFAPLTVEVSSSTPVPPAPAIVGAKRKGP
jgi:hypothetical protein